MGKSSVEKDKVPAELAEWISSAIKGEEWGYSQLVDYSYPKLFRFFLYMCRSKEEADDLCQDTFIRAFNNLKSLKEPEKFSSWLLTVGRNTFLNTKRKKQVDTVSEENFERLEGSESQNETAIEIRQTLAKLPEEVSMVLLLVDLEGMGYAEAGEVLGISENALRSRLHRARKEFESIWNKNQEKRVA